MIWMRRSRYVRAALVLAFVTAVPAAGAATRTPGADAPAVLTLRSVTLEASWKESWLTGTVKFEGTATAVSGPVEVIAALRPVDRPGAPAGSARISLPSPGSFAGGFKLPRRLLPGLYRLTVTGVAGGMPLTAATRTVRNPAPSEGVVDVAVASSRKGGPKANTVAGPRRELWARFHFVVPPKASTVRVAWFSPDFKWYGIAQKPYESTVETHVRTDAALMKGVWFCYAGVNGRYVKRVRIRIS